MLFLKTFKDAKFVVDGNAFQTFITLSTKKLLSNASCASRFKHADAGCAVGLSAAKFHYMDPIGQSLCKPAGLRQSPLGPLSGI